MSTKQRKARVMEPITSTFAKIQLTQAHLNGFPIVTIQLSGNAPHTSNGTLYPDIGSITANQALRDVLVPGSYLPGANIIVKFTGQLDVDNFTIN